MESINIIINFFQNSLFSFNIIILQMTLFLFNLFLNKKSIFFFIILVLNSPISTIFSKKNIKINFLICYLLLDLLLRFRHLKFFKKTFQISRQWFIIADLQFLLLIIFLKYIFFLIFLVKSNRTFNNVIFLSIH